MRRTRGFAILTAIGLLASTALLVPSGVAHAAKTPTVKDTQLAPGITVDTKSKITVKAPNPAADQDKTKVSFDFSSKHTYKSRWVSVQVSLDKTTWVSVKVLKMSANGKGSVSIPGKYQAYKVRAVALEATYKKKAYALVATAAAKAASYWDERFFEDFKSAQSNQFASREVGKRYEKRVCSTPSESNVKVSSGNLKLKLLKDKTPSTDTKKAIESALSAARESAVAKAEAARAKAEDALKAAKANKQKLSAKKKKAAVAAAKKKLNAAEKSLKAAKKLPTKVATGCPQGVFTNAMVGTQNTFTLPKGASGVVTARVKFPKAKGMHGAVWLQSATGHEIDIFESFGHGGGVASYVHLPQKDGSTVKKGGYVAKAKVKKAAWFDKWHTVSVEYDSKRVVYRLDGKVTKTIKKDMTGREYYIVLSLLSSDWELPRLKKKTTSATMQVDWVKAYVKTKA